MIDLIRNEQICFSNYLVRSTLPDNRFESSSPGLVPGSTHAFSHLKFSRLNIPVGYRLISRCGESSANRFQDRALALKNRGFLLSLPAVIAVHIFRLNLGFKQPHIFLGVSDRQRPAG